MTRFCDRFEAVGTPAIQYTFGETATYYPASGAPRSGLCTVDETAAMPDEETGLVSEQHLIVTVQRRESDDNPDALIIDSPALGDGFQREGDPDDKRYSWSGEQLEVTADSWRLRFIRKIPFIIGGGRVRKR